MAKIIKFVEKYFLCNVTILNLSIFLICYLFFKDTFDKLVKWIINITYVHDGNLITISTVFIGIYFTLYTYLLSVSSDSILAKIELKEFKRLARMINIGFVSSLSVVLLSFFKTDKFWYYLIISLSSFLLLISAVEIAIYYTLIFKRDLDGKFNELQKQKIEARKDELLKKELKDFLERNK